MEETMSKKQIGVVMIIVGVVLVFLSLAADYIGIGAMGFGWKQITGTGIGVIGIVYGVWLILRKKGKKAKKS